ncbi:DUF1330 domain-containing protein [Prevotella sp. 10(H)]|uniref:DUF1330 domain-containing protein n=1 Tax=Prevotella sp. 10(H) TaxID=1158294 RepID=UPI0004A6F074|nr:DUF1330 domain-containing protein [Prevotella sp. 10(H)]
MAAFFIVNIQIPDKTDRDNYDEYIARVKPIVESYGGRYIVRSEHILLFAGDGKPDRVIIIEFDDRQQLDNCFASLEYASVKGLRENNVKTEAYIVEQ